MCAQSSEKRLDFIHVRLDEVRYGRFPFGFGELDIKRSFFPKPQGFCLGIKILKNIHAEN